MCSFLSSCSRACIRHSRFSAAQRLFADKAEEGRDRGRKQRDFGRMAATLLSMVGHRSPHLISLSFGYLMALVKPLAQEPVPEPADVRPIREFMRQGNEIMHDLSARLSRFRRKLQR